MSLLVAMRCGECGIRIARPTLAGRVELVEGDTLKDAPAFAGRLRRVLEKALG